MEREYKTEELKAVWGALLKAYSEKQEGCTAQDIASATGLSEEVARACLEYLCQDKKAVREGKAYAPDPRYVRDVTIKHAMKVVDKYLREKKRATVGEIVRGIQNEEGENIRREFVEEALRYLAGAGRVRFNQLTGRWDTTLREV